MAESSGLVTVVGDDGKTYVADQKTVQAKQVQQMMAQGGNFFWHHDISKSAQELSKENGKSVLNQRVPLKTTTLGICVFVCFMAV